MLGQLSEAVFLDAKEDPSVIGKVVHEPQVAQTVRAKPVLSVA